MDGGDGSALSASIDAWLQPLGDTACGEDLVYDNSFLSLTKAAAGKPGTQFKDFEDAEPPDWQTARNIAEEMFERTRDVRVAVLWTRAVLALEGSNSLPQGLRLVHGLLESFWDELHPLPDDGDPYERVNALTDMCSQSGLLGDLRQGVVFRNRMIGELTVRQVELALGLLDPREGEYPPDRSHLEDMLSDACAQDPALAAFPRQALQRIEALNELMSERVGYGAAPDLQPLADLLRAIASVMPDPSGKPAAVDEAPPAEDGDDAPHEAPAGARPRGGGRGLSGGIESREDALRAIDMVCAYLERTEPTNPAQLLLRRARRLVNNNFLQLIRELAPESLQEVARIMGVSADEIPMVSSDD